MTERELTCRELAGFAADYFAGALDAEERSLFDAHLGECPDCVVYLRSYADTMRLAKDAHADEPVSDEVPEELVRAILEARSKPRRKR